MNNLTPEQDQKVRRDAQARLAAGEDPQAKYEVWSARDGYVKLMSADHAPYPGFRPTLYTLRELAA